MQSRLQSNKEQKCLKNRSVPAHGAGGSALLQLHITWTSRLHGHFYHKKKKTRVLLLKSNLVSRFARNVQSKRCRIVQNGSEWCKCVQRFLAAFATWSPNDTDSALLWPVRISCCTFCEFLSPRFCGGHYGVYCGCELFANWQARAIEYT